MSPALHLSRRCPRSASRGFVAGRDGQHAGHNVGVAIDAELWLHFGSSEAVNDALRRAELGHFIGAGRSDGQSPRRSRLAQLTENHDEPGRCRFVRYRHGGQGPFSKPGSALSSLSHGSCERCQSWSAGRS